MNIERECDKATLKLQEAWNHVYNAHKELRPDLALWDVLNNLASAQTQIALALNALARVTEREGFSMNIEVREIQQHAILNARANLAIKTHRAGFSFSMLDGTHDDGVVYPSRTDAEAAGIQWIALHRTDLIGTGELI